MKLAAHLPLIGKTSDQQVSSLGPSMEIRNTKLREEVQEVYQWSLAQTALGQLEQIPNWDTASTWHNAWFRDAVSRKQWVVYLPDQAWPGEVRLVTT